MEAGATRRSDSGNEPATASGAAAPAVRVRALRKRFAVSAGGDLAVLDGIDLDARRCEFVSVIGPSGCGKTTLLQVIAGLQAEDSGTVEVDRDHVALVFQRPILLPWRTVLRNVTFGLECRGRRAREVRDEAMDLLGKMGLADFARFMPHELSRGMAQRVDLARALLLRPRVLLMDEPFASLDVETREAMHRELLLRWEEQGLTVVFVSHTVEEVAALSDRVVFLTAKPARVAREVEVGLPRPRGADAEARVALVRRAEELRTFLV
ncbi:MAG: ABC transporter ATP-binding protein [Deltaproteobacteria bacterium]|nr:ABC transporter ATP-binding protein [Deltaproteobacteria bacterium]